MQLLERASQLQALNSALSEVAGGAGCVALVYGEAGIGKTSLVEHFVKAQTQDWRVLTGACDLLFTPRPLDALRDIATQVGGRLLSLIDSGCEQGALFAACLTELKSQPTILVIENIHWADEATLDLLKYLGRRILQTTCLVILTYRDDEIGAEHPLRLVLGDLASSSTIHRIPVLPLSVDGVRELAKNRDVDAVALHRLTNGNPFFVTEVLAGEGDIPQTVRDAVLARAARLSASARRVLEAAAVIGLQMEVWLLSGIPGVEVVHIQECISKGILQPQVDGYAFRHQLARDIVLESISPLRRIELNGAILAVLEATPETREDLTRLANHAAGTNDAGAVLRHAPPAARQAAAAGAHRQAAALYALGLRFAGALSAEEHAQMLEAYADEQRYLDYPQTLIPVRRENIQKYRALGDPLKEASNLALLASELHGIGHAAEAQEAIQTAVGMLEALPPSVELARAYQVQSFILLNEVGFLEGLEAAEKAIRLAERFDDPETLARACSLAGEASFYRGDQRGPAFMERSLTVGRRHGLDYAICLAMCNWAWALVETWQFDEAIRLLEEGIRYAAQHNDDYHGPPLVDLHAQIQFCRGNWKDAAAGIQKAQQRSDMTVLQQIFCLQLRGRLAVRSGDPCAPQVLAEALTLSAETQYLYFVGGIRAARAAAAWLKGDNQRAIEETQAAYDWAVSQHVPWIAGELAFWRWRAGDIFTPPEWIAPPYALQIAGDWQGAAKEWERRGCPYEQALALMDGDRAAQLAALQTFQRLGARPILANLKSKLRAEGVHFIPRGPRAATRRHPFGLTVRELDILSCLAKGPSNQAIAQQLGLSRRTVEHHISAILQKTGAQSRRDLVALALKENLLPVE